MNIRKMQTASGGPIRRIKFTPEQIAKFERQFTSVPGMNNSGGNKYREEDVLALKHLEQEAKRKEEEIKSRMEMRPTLKRKVTTAEKLQGKKDEYELKPQIVEMSGTDPVGEFILAGIGLNGAGTLAKIGAWETARLFPTSYFGNLARLYFVGNTLKNVISNGTKYPVYAVVKSPIVISEEARKAYVPTRMNFSKTSFPKLDMYKDAFPIKMDKPFMYDELNNMFIPNKNYYYRRGWGIIDDAIETGRIRVPEGDYKSIALKKYPLLDNGNPLSTALLNHKFPYFSEGELWDAMGKYGVEPEDLIAVPKDISNVLWVAGSKWGDLLINKSPSEVGGRATPLFKGEINLLPTHQSYLFKYIDGRYRPMYWKQGGKMNILELLKNGSGIHIKKKNRGKFTKSAKAAGLSVQEHAKSVLNDPNATPLLKKRANFARNAAKWKHKEGGVIKALDGINTLNFWLKAGNFLNSDTGKGLIGLGSLIFNGLKTGSDIANFSNSFDSATDSKVAAMESKMRADSYLKGLQKAKLVIALKQLLDPNVRFGEIDLMNMALNFSNEFYDSDAINEYKTYRANLKLRLMQAILGSGSTGIFDSLGGLASSVLNSGLFNKKSRISSSWNKALSDLSGTSFIKPDITGTLITTSSGTAIDVDKFRALNS